MEPMVAEVNIPLASQSTGTPGQSGAKVEFIVPESAPNTLYYYCTNHSGMGGSQYIVVKTLVGNDVQGATGAQGQQGSGGSQVLLVPKVRMVLKVLKVLKV